MEEHIEQIITGIMEKVDRKGVQSDCKKILKKLSLKSDKDTGYVTELAVWLYVYGYYEEAVQAADLLKNVEFTGNYTVWSNVDHALCVKARILRERGEAEESRKLIDRVNEHRSPELYLNGLHWFMNTLDQNIESNLRTNSKAGARSWRLLKLEMAIAYREAGRYPVPDEELEGIIAELATILAAEK